MLSIEITIPAIAFIGALAVAAAAGFAVRSVQSSIKKNRILQLEQEVLDAHEQILDLHKKMASSTPNTKSAPVVPIKEKLTSDSKHSDSSQQKKMPQ